VYSRTDFILYKTPGASLLASNKADGGRHLLRVYVRTQPGVRWNIITWPPLYLECLARGEGLMCRIYNPIRLSQTRKLGYRTTYIWPRILSVLLTKVFIHYTEYYIQEQAEKHICYQRRKYNMNLNIFRKLQSIFSLKTPTFVLHVFKLAGPNRWAGASVGGCGGGVDIDLKKSQLKYGMDLSTRAHINSRVISTGVSRNGSQITSRRCRRSATSYHELCAFRVELRCVCLMQSQQLVSDEIISWSKCRGNSTRPLEILVNDCSPPTRACKWRSSHAHLIDLEPSGALSVTTAEWTTTLIHPYHDWPLLMSPLSVDLISTALWRKRIRKLTPK